MCDPVTLTGIAIGATVGATTSAITGQDPLMGALMGGAMGGFFPGSFGITPGSSFGSALVGSAAGPTFVTGLGANIALGGVASATAMGLAGGMAMNMLTPQQQNYNLANTGMPYTPQAYSSQHSTVTGSGGRQAAAVLASEIKQAKSLRQRQAGVADYGLGMDMAGTGLQIA